MAAERQHMFASSVAEGTVGNLDIYTVTCGLRKKTPHLQQELGKVAWVSMVCHGKIIVVALKKEQPETGGSEGV